jgi:hypothetical protein
MEHDRQLMLEDARSFEGHLFGQTDVLDRSKASWARETPLLRDGLIYQLTRGLTLVALDQNMSDGTVRPLHLDLLVRRLLRPQGKMVLSKVWLARR